jgi:death-on-curing protein
MKEPLFLTLAEVLETHKNQIELYGGDLGIRDLGLLQSALAQPEASFDGEWLHPTLLDMASAYAYHICQNHPFIDGNKRAALATALIFLEMNGLSILDPNQKLLEAMLKMASSKLSKKEFARILEQLCGK